MWYILHRFQSLILIKKRNTWTDIIKISNVDVMATDDKNVRFLTGATNISNFNREHKD